MQSGGRANNFQKFRQNDDQAGCFVLTRKTAADTNTHMQGTNARRSF